MNVQKDHIDIWFVEINHTNYYHALTARHLLSEFESKKQNNFHFDKDKKNYLISHIALRLILSKYLSTSPELIRYQYNQYSKPFINGCSKELHFNLSHSNKLACIAIALKEVGIDIEYIHKNFNYLEIAKNYFSPEERNLIYESRSSTERIKMFFKIWTMKEALLKGIGTGLTNNLPSINLNNTQWHYSKFEYNNWQIMELEIFQKDYISSLAYQGRNRLDINYYNYAPTN